MNITQIDRYIIKGQLGQGGMATVYHAYDPGFERDVAIKVLPETLLVDPQFRIRFMREARAIARLEHPMIVPVYDIGEINQQPYIVMRYMSGGSLTDRIRAGALALEEAAQIVNRIALALDAAHEQGIVHRDLKPGNILFDQRNQAYLSDFGIAHIGQADGPTLTGNLIIGTPAYMSPEQARGQAKIDGRSDIYSLGATLFEMLSGRLPFEADTPMGQAMKHLIEPVPDILALRPDLPPKVRQVIGRAMEKEPQQRYPTAETMSKALNLLVQETPTAVSEPQRPPEATLIEAAPWKPEVPAPTQAPAAGNRAATSRPAAPTLAQRQPTLGQHQRPLLLAGVALLLLVVVALAVGPVANWLANRPGTGAAPTRAAQALPTTRPTALPSPAPTRRIEPTATLEPSPVPMNIPAIPADWQRTPCTPAMVTLAMPPGYTAELYEDTYQLFIMKENGKTDIEVQCGPAEHGGDFKSEVDWWLSFQRYVTWGEITPGPSSVGQMVWSVGINTKGNQVFTAVIGPTANQHVLTFWGMAPVEEWDAAVERFKLIASSAQEITP